MTRTRWRTAGVAAAVLAVLAGAANLKLASQAQQPNGNDVAVIEPEVKEFLAGLARNEFDAAFATLLEDSAFRADSPEVLNLIARAKEVPLKYGRFHKAERIDAKSVADGSVILLRYLFKCERLPVIWYFTYYRPMPESDWTLVTVRFDTRLEELAE